jgi:drug/metabolite transporter (DMT)-like permease
MTAKGLQSTIEPLPAAPFSVTTTTARWRWLPIASVLLVACCWATQGVAYELILDGIQTDGLTVVTLRAITSMAVLWGWLAVTDRSALKIPRADLPAFALLGFVAITIFYPALFYAYAWTGVSVATTLLYLAPALVALGAAMFLGEALTRGKGMALMLTFVGSALVLEVTQPANLTGNAAGIALGLVSAASYATYNLLGKHLLRRHRMATVLAAYLLLGTLLLLALKLIVAPWTWPDSGEALTIGLYTGVMTTLVPITLFTFGLSRLPSGDATILLTFEPVVAFVLAAVVLGESLNAGQWLGVAAVLGGVALLTSSGRAPVPTGIAKQFRSNDEPRQCWLGTRIGCGPRPAHRLT